MKAKIFTLFILMLGTALTGFSQGLNAGTGVQWGSLGASEPLLLEEDFTGFTFFHSDSTPDMGNSNNVFADNGVDIIMGYTNDSIEVAIPGSSSKITYVFNQCAFAPEWQTAYDFKYLGGQTPDVSNGFVEVSREYGASGGYAPTVRGYFKVDLRQIEFVEVIQWSHSSCGGNKRGVQCEISLDDGATWDTLRYQPGGGAWNQSFTKDPMTGIKTPNGYNCQPSAYGMTWEDGIYASNVMIRFIEAGGQVPRIHDLKVYGSVPTSAIALEENDLEISSFNKKIRISKEANVAVYNITGSLVRIAEGTNSVSMDDMPVGIYLVKAQAGTQYKAAKVLIK